MGRFLWVESQNFKIHLQVQIRCWRQTPVLASGLENSPEAISNKRSGSFIMILHPIILICGTAQPLPPHHTKSTPAIPFPTNTEEANAFPLHSGTPSIRKSFSNNPLQTKYPKNFTPPFFWSLETHIFNLTSFVINFRKEHELIHKKGQGKLFWKIKKKKAPFSPQIEEMWREYRLPEILCPNSLSFIPAIVANLPRLFEILFLKRGGESGESVSPVPIKTSIWQSGLVRLALPHGHFKEAATSP